MKVLFSGDTHCDKEFTIRLIEHAKGNDCKVIMVAGDFGLWEHTKFGLEFTRTISERLVENNIKLFFVDGNHENHNDIRLYQSESTNGIAKIKENIYHISRGTIIKIDNTSIMGFGGAYSIDKMQRKVNVSWWPQETITEEDYQRAIKNFNLHGKKIDILLTHEGPLNFSGYVKSDIHSNIQREWIQKLVKEIKPELLIHGHYHVYVDYKYDDVICKCLPGEQSSIDKTIIMDL